MYRIIWSVLLFIILLIFVLVVKPNFLFDHSKKKYRTFGIKKGQTLITFEIILILLAVFSYCTTFYISMYFSSSIKSSPTVSVYGGGGSNSSNVVQNTNTSLSPYPISSSSSSTSFLHNAYPTMQPVMQQQQQQQQQQHHHPSPYLQMYPPVVNTGVSTRPNETSISDVLTSSSVNNGNFYDSILERAPKLNWSNSLYPGCR